MRTIDRTKSFKKDYKRLKRSGHHHHTLDNALLEVVALLATDQPLSQRHCDHPLTGNWNDHRDCHIKPDVVLIYRKPNDDMLELVRLGSHSELGL